MVVARPRLGRGNGGCVVWVGCDAGLDLLGFRVWKACVGGNGLVVFLVGVGCGGVETEVVSSCCGDDFFCWLFFFFLAEFLISLNSHVFF